MLLVSTSLTVLHFSHKFVERYNERNKAQAPAARVRKIAASPPPKLGRRQWNVDDTDSSSDDEDRPQVTNAVDPYLEEWSLYLNTNEAVPDDMGIVQWWGVRTLSLFPVSVSHRGSVVVWRPLSDMALTCARLSFHHGLISIQ
jgi:hypothetical protein